MHHSQSPIGKRTGNFAETDIDDETVLMHIGTGQFFALKATGRAIWQLIDGERSKDAIRAELMARYAVDEKTCDIELDQFLSDMRKAEFVTSD